MELFIHWFVTPNFDVDFEEHPTPADGIQRCDCSDVRLAVRSSGDRQQFLNFRAVLAKMDGRKVKEKTVMSTSVWQTEKVQPGFYRLQVEPQIGTEHHDYRDIPLDGSFETFLTLHANKTADVTLNITRKDSILYDILPYRIYVAANEDADASRPWYESEAGAILTSDMDGFASAMTEASSRFGVPRNWMLSIAWMEMTHGYYDEPLEWFDANDSLQPMNINISYWSRLFTRAQMTDTRENILAGGFMLHRLRARVHPMDLPRVATTYNGLGLQQINDYGARVESIHRQRYVEGALIPE